MVCGKEEIKTFLFFLILLFPTGMNAQSVAQEDQKKEVRREEEYNKRINFGIKGGFRSSNYIVSDFWVDDTRIKDLQNNYRMGYYAALYARFNFKRRFWQTEVSYNIDRAEMILDKSGTGVQSTDASVTSNIRSLGFPLLYGYYIVRKGPYTMSVFAGPKLEYIYKYNITYSNFDQNDIRESLHPLNISVITGLSVSISKVFFDFRYEQEAKNISKSIVYDQSASDGTSSTGGIKFHRRESCLSFSFGVLF